MKNKILFLVVSVLLLKIDILSAQIVKEVYSHYNTLTIKLDALPLCSADFDSYNYNHFLPPLGYRDKIEENTLLYFSLFEHIGKVKSLQVNTYIYYEEFGDKKKSLKAYNKADFDENGKVINLDYEPQRNSGYNHYDEFKIIGDGNLAQLEAEYDEEGRVCRRYLGNKKVSMDYEYDDHGRVVKITFDTGEYTRDGSNIATVKYSYDTRQGHENYITSIESFIGTRKDGKAILSYNSNDLRLKKIKISHHPFFEEQTWEYEYNVDGKFTKIINKTYYAGEYERTGTCHFDRMWAAGSNSLVCFVKTVVEDKRNYKSQHEDTYVYTFDEHGNWIQLESEDCIFERKIEYFIEETNTNISNNLCLECGKPLTNNNAFCEYCGTEQAVFLASQQWEKLQEEKKQETKKVSQTNTNNIIELVGESNITNIENETNNISLKTNNISLKTNNISLKTNNKITSDNIVLIFLIISVLIVLGKLFYKLKKK